MRLIFVRSDKDDYFINHRKVSPVVFYAVREWWKEEEERLREERLRELGETVNHPDHYAKGRKFEPIDVIEDWELGFCLGNAVKYISRAGRKEDTVNDLEKAKWYLEREIKKLKG